jgi:hypothetical protein
MFLFSKASLPALGQPQSTFQNVPAVLYPEIKRPDSETDHLPPSSAEGTNEWSYTSSSTYALMAGTRTTIPTFHPKDTVFIDR